MKPIDFNGRNIMIAESQSQYLSLPARVEHDFDLNSPLIMSCWKLNLFERIRCLFSGKIWVSVLTFSKPLQPMMLDTEIPFER